VPLSSREIIKRLKADGWIIDRHAGSHVQLHHPEKPGTVTVPHPRKDFPKGTLHSIEKQSGVSLR
jgi:predicted RNA binding protein YcfA (HicA-like mRNA interferase family)